MTNSFPPSARLDDDLVWVQVLTDGNAFAGRPALFLDRDGALIVERHYLSDPAEVALEAGAGGLVRRANAANVAVVIVTNQSGIARARYGWDAFARVQEQVLADLAAQDAHVDAVFACGHHKNGVGDYAHPNHPARKPNPGMLTRSKDALGIDLGRSWIIGDKADDMMAGRRAGCAGGIHVLTGHGNDVGERDKALAVARDAFAVCTADTIGDAVPCLPFLD